MPPRSREARSLPAGLLLARNPRMEREPLRLGPRASHPTSSPPPPRGPGHGPGCGHTPWRPFSKCRSPHTAGELPPSPFLPDQLNAIRSALSSVVGVCVSGKAGMKQQSDIRAQWQHSTVPVEKLNALPRQATLRAHGHRSRTGIGRNTLNQSALTPGAARRITAPHPTGPAPAFSNPTAEAQRPPAATLTTRDQPPAEFSHQEVSGLTGAVQASLFGRFGATSRLRPAIWLARSNSATPRSTPLVRTSMSLELS
jgi:hypothetical protein